MQVSQVQWDFDAWEDYLYWQHQDKRVFKIYNSIFRSATEGVFS